MTNRVKTFRHYPASHSNTWRHTRKIKEIRDHLISLDRKDLVLVDFSTVAQYSKTYEEYEQVMKETDNNDLHYIGIGVYAEKKIVNKSTGNLSLIR